MERHGGGVTCQEAQEGAGGGTSTFSFSFFTMMPPTSVPPPPPTTLGEGDDGKEGVEEGEGEAVTWSDLMAPTLMAASEAERPYVFCISLGRKVARPVIRKPSKAPERERQTKVGFESKLMIWWEGELLPAHA